jgi:hypothetical protein
MILTILSTALLSSASPAMLAAKEPAAEKQICKREKQIGSMVRAKKTCRTKAEWDDLAAQSREEVSRAQRATSFPGG